MTKSTSKKESFSSGGILTNTQGQIALVLMDDENWSFPKGHIEEHESKLDAAKREVREETGVGSFELINELGTYQRPCADDENEIKHITLFLFKTSETNLNPTAKDVTKAIWVDVSKVKSILSFQKDQEFFESLGGQLRDALA
jgi:8-oxo-dGTP diphosphatase